MNNLLKETALHHATIGQKIAYLILFVSLITLSLGGAAFIAYQFVSARHALVHDLTTQAAIISNLASAALAFSDNQGAHEILASLKAKPNILEGTIYTPAGDVFAYFQRFNEKPTASVALLGVSAEPSSYQQHGILYVVYPIVLEQQWLGRVYLSSSLAMLYQQVWQVVGIAMAVLVASWVIALLLGQRLASRLTQPLRRLTTAIEQVSKTRDYSLQVSDNHSQDEIGLLTQHFNAMLREINARDQALNTLNDHLELTVQERTRDLQQAKLRAESADRAKTTFLANMSHEIRTPLTAIMGFISLLIQKGYTEAERMNFIDTVHRNSQYLLHIISDILDISKIESGEMQVELTDFSLLDVLLDLDSMMRVKAQEKNIPFMIEILGKMPDRVRSDPVKMRQILTNLIGNAIKFTHQGEVRVEVRVELQPPATDGWIYLVVRDTGIGIPYAQQQAVFQPFKQADASTTRTYGGTGLGLAITQSLIHLLGGKITLQSHPGFGSQFSVRLPSGPLTQRQWLEKSSLLAAPVLSTEPATDIPKLGGRVLLVEDGEDNQLLLSHYLNAAGIAITIRDNGLTGYHEALAQWRQGTGYDLILCDMQMPVMDGYTAVRHLRAEGYPGPIVALTAHALEGDRTQCLQAGCNDYCSKPVSQAHLLKVLATYLPHLPGKTPETVALAALPSEYLGMGMDALIHGFVARLPEQVAELTKAQQAQDTAQLCHIAHQLAGCAGGYGFQSITQAARTLEHQIRQGMPQWDAAYQALITLCQRAAQSDHTQASDKTQSTNT